MAITEKELTKTNSQFESINLAVKTLINHRYVIEEKIGIGGFGTVYKAYDKILACFVALKFLHLDIVSNNKNFIRIKREINLSRKITDKKIIKIYSLEEWENNYFLVMEFIQGKSLKEILKVKERFTWEEFKNIFFQILEGIKTLHQMNIIHRDLKPSNIMISANQEIKILDFGLAKEIDDPQKTSSTGEIIGSPYYISPEQGMGEIIGISSDIYQLGLILYTALCGKLPFDSSNTMEIIYKHINTRPGKISSQGFKIPSFVEFAIGKALEKKRKNRFRTVREMFEFLKKEKFSILKFINLKLKILRNKYWLILPVIILSSLFFISNFKKLNSIQAEGSILTAKNFLGIKHWQKDYTPYQIKLAYIYNNQAAGQKTPAAKKQIIVFLTRIRPGLFPVEQSINEVGPSDLILKLNFKGREFYRNSSVRASGLRTYDYIKSGRFAEIKREDYDHDGQLETVFITRQILSMFPTSFSLMQADSMYNFSNPGGIRYYKIINLKQNFLRAWFFGYNNLFSHMNFFAEIKMKANQTIHGFPNLTTQSVTGLENNFLHYSLLPPQSKLINNLWMKKGVMKFVDTSTNETITVRRNHTLEVESMKGKKTYQDSPQILSRVFHLFNQFYREKNKTGNLQKSAELINKILSYKIENPYLKSALIYIQGDLTVLLGKYIAGRNILQKSLKYYPYNNDAAQRICEIDFLAGNSKTAIKTAKTRYSHISSFYGSNYAGKQLFEGYCHLQSGEFKEAEAKFTDAVSAQGSPVETIQKGIISLFKGDYAKALDSLRNFEKKYIHNFTVQEYRLMLARARILAGQETGLAEFHLNDLAAFSITRKHLAKISLAYLLAKKGGGKEAEKMAKAAFKEIINYSKGDLETRLWLFYDAYIYAKTMEYLGQKQEALKGYRTCIQANPHTALARASQKALKILN